jgi:hypothetical protein
MQLARVITESPSLPPKPIVDNGRAVFWVYVLGEPGFSYRGQHMLVTPEVIDQHVRRFSYLTARGYRPPLLAGHPAEFHALAGVGELGIIADELRVGDILEVKRWTVDGRQALIAAISPAMPAEAAQRAVDTGLLRYLSPGLGTVETDEGDILTLVLKELSVVTNPHQKTGMTHILGAEQEHTMEDIQPTLADLMAMIQGLHDMVKEALDAKALEASEVTPPLEVVDPEVELLEDAEADPRVAELEKEVMQLREQAFLAKLPAGKNIVLNLNKSTMEALATLNRTTPEAVAVLLGEQPATAPATAARANRPAPVRPIGGEGTPAPTRALAPADQYAMLLRECNGDRIKANEKYLKVRRQAIE